MNISDSNTSNVSVEFSANLLNMNWTCNCTNAKKLKKYYKRRDSALEEINNYYVRFNSMIHAGEKIS